MVMLSDGCHLCLPTGLQRLGSSLVQAQNQKSLIEHSDAGHWLTRTSSDTEDYHVLAQRLLEEGQLEVSTALQPLQFHILLSSGTH